MNLQTLLFFLVLMPVMFFGLLWSLVLNLFDKSGNKFHGVASWWGRFSAKLLGIAIEVEGEENYQPDQNYLVVSNHAGMADIPLILGAMKLNIRFMAKEELGKIPVFGWALKTGGYVMVKRGQNREALQSMLQAVDTLKSGKSIHIFPEGTRSKTGDILPFKRGAFIIAQKAGVPVLPVTIIGSHLITPKKSLKINKGKIRLIIGKPIAPGKNPSAETLMEESYKVISKNLEKNAA
ncbi:acyl-phosphate glycerol 3-phosphate acyltransferase [Chlorobaculum limnaeum]|uniref:1-acyl-sn-glycerol-3-phosphate acyltransferase n=1 Tax=Chlorobaculum limnaeum TaxID=274537 RepID=A0A1D8D8P3_CHLLM|nr:lysophospholipid acyltransferase family protein [Chlorobaculum limnaeum]AOS84598.1 acyl-phosphate glycerol 3-phosphate acyltransferase [Chlorobaculum limnaeum]